MKKEFQSIIDIVNSRKKIDWNELNNELIEACKNSTPEEEKEFCDTGYGEMIAMRCN